MGDISKDFDRSEFACKCSCGFDTVDVELIAVLQDLRDVFGAIIVNSGCRCPTHNINVGGSQFSQHLYGKAADIRTVYHGLNQDKVADYLEAKYPNKYGIGRYIGRTHIDVRPDKYREDNR